MHFPRPSFSQSVTSRQPRLAASLDLRDRNLRAFDSYPVPAPRGNIDGSPPLVWIVNQYAVTTDQPGITRHVELAMQLAEHGWHARIFATGFHHTTATMQHDLSIWNPIQDEVQDGVQFSWMYSSRYRRNGFRRYVNMLSFTGNLIVHGLGQERPDIIIGSSPHLLAAFGAWVLARRWNVPFIFEVRDLWPDMLEQLGLTNPLVIRPLTAIERLLYRQADCIIALTDGIVDRIACKGVPRDKLVMIPNSSLKPAPLNEAARHFQRRFLGWENRTVLIWAGSHNPMNGLDVVIEAAKLLQHRHDILFAFVGDGSVKDELVLRAAGLQNVTFYDPVPKTEIGNWLRAADIGLLHSRRFEAFLGARPNKLFEYMAASLALVTTVPGEALRIVQEANAGTWAEWENPPALASAIASLADQPDLRREMGKRGFAYVSREHSREVTAAQLAALLAKHKSRGFNPGGRSAR